MPKATEAFRNIGEVSADLGIRKHVLRFWEAKFPQLKPMKRGGGRRYYRPGDVLLLRGIQHLLQTSGYTIKGVQKILREEGVEDVKRIGSEREAARGTSASGRPGHAPASEGNRPLTQADFSALRAIAAELETVRAMLSSGAIQQSEEPVRRSRRASARG